MSHRKTPTTVTFDSYHPQDDQLEVRQLTPAPGDNAALQLMILIDETLNTSIGNILGDIRNLINGQPPTTVSDRSGTPADSRRKDILLPCHHYSIM
ncbi:MAG TPA: hypothetical protein VHM93_01590 [Candidatus Acidoferrum sp.]|jgi:hypothetical protein|nr:hypothetical protein [Candidatus Acidoferrum sp.]